MTQFQAICGTAYASACIFGSCNSTQCVCQTGYMPNNILTRVDDCSLPDWYFDFALGSTLAVCALGLILSSANARNSRGELRWTKIILILALMCLGGACIIGLAEQKFSRAFWVVVAGFHLGICLTGYRITRIFFVTTHSALLKSHQANMHLHERIILLVQLCTAIPLGAFVPVAVLVLGDDTAPGYNVGAYNTIVAWAHGAICPIASCMVPSCIVVSSHLLALVKEQQGHIDIASPPNPISDQLKDVEKRIVLFRAMIYCVPLATLLNLTLCTSIAYTQRWPVVGYFGALNLFASAGIVLHLIRVLTPASASPATTQERPKNPTRSKSSSANASSNNKIPGAEVIAVQPGP